MVESKSRYSCARKVPPFAVSATGVSGVPAAWFFSRHPAGYRRRAGRLFLAVCWICGLLCGVIFVSTAGIPLSPRMRPGLGAPVSIRRMLCTSLLPFFLTAVALLASGPVFLYGLAFGKAFSLACAGLLVSCLWDGGAWLARGLVCFTGTLAAPLLYGFWLRCLSGPRFALTPPRAAWLACMAAALGSIDYFIIAPLLARLIYF